MCPWCASTSFPIRKGFFKKKSTRTEKVQRFYCKACCRHFSDQTGSLTYRERKPHLNQSLFRLLVNGVSQRACAKILGCHRTTVDKKLCRMGRAAHDHLAHSDGSNIEPSVVVFDEMETFEHTKCKPIAIALAVVKKNREIIAVEAASMPAKGKPTIARKKYGQRRDERSLSLNNMALTIKAKIPNLTQILSDKCPRYPKVTKEHFPGVEHVTYKGRRGCVVGQGELKRGGFDPLFSLNHTAAMFRDHLKRLARRTWCTTKRIDRLRHLLWMYAYYHNESIKRSNRLVRI